MRIINEAQRAFDQEIADLKSENARLELKLGISDEMTSKFFHDADCSLWNLFMDRMLTLEHALSEKERIGII